MNRELDYEFCGKCKMLIYKIRNHLKRNRCQAYIEKRYERVLIRKGLKTRKKGGRNDKTN